jgi:glycosyltransferase involved in cell wall biosynthesis
MQSRQGLAWLQAQVPTARGVVIPNPVAAPLPDAAPVVPIVAGDARKVLLAVGRLEPQKAFDVLVQAFAQLAARHASWDLVVLGEGSQRATLEAQVRALGLAGRVAMPGRAGNVGAWYRRADLYVMSSLFEGFPNTLAEAMAHGCAVVSYDCDTGPRDIIRHEQDGLLVRPVGDVAALARALDRLMADDAARERMAAGAADVRERFSLPSVLAEWETVLHA